MGLKFCNEAIIALEEIWPTRKEEVMPLSPLQVSSSKEKKKKYTLFLCVRFDEQRLKCKILSHATFIIEYFSCILFLVPFGIIYATFRLYGQSGARKMIPPTLLSLPLILCECVYGRIVVKLFWVNSIIICNMWRKLCGAMRIKLLPRMFSQIISEEYSRYLSNMKQSEIEVEFKLCCKIR